MIRETIIKEMQIRGHKGPDLARGIDVNRQTIYNFIKKGWIRLEVLDKICAFYGLELMKRY